MNLIASCVEPPSLCILHPSKQLPLFFTVVAANVLWQAM